MDESEIEVPEQVNDIDAPEHVHDVDKVKDLDRAQYELGFQARLDGEPLDEEQCPAWQLGWNAAARQL